MKNNDLLPAPPPVRRKRGLTGWIVFGVLVLAVALGLWFGRGKLGFAKAPGAAGAASGAASGARAGTAGAGGPGGGRFGGANRTQPVSIDTVRRRDLRVTVGAIGTLTAANTATVRPQVSGVLQSLQFKEGQTVKAGQQLAQIDPRAFQAALSQAEGTLARDRAQLENARTDLARYQDLLQQDAIARQQVDTQAALVRQLEGTVKTDQAGVETARLQLSYTRVTAPISGRAGLKQADLGNIVGASDANGIVVIAQTQPIALVFSVPSAQLPAINARLRAGDPLPVVAYDRDGKTRLATGRVASIDNAIDTSTDSVKLKALFENKDEALFPNQSVSVKLQTGTVQDALTVPNAALLRGAQGFYVYVVGDDDSVATRVVTPGQTDGQVTEVTGAVREGERVVIDGVDRLRDGAKVEIIAADPAQRQGASAPQRPQLSPEMREKVSAMSPEERRAFFEKLRAERAASGAAQPASAASK